MADLEDSIFTDQGGEIHYLFAEGDQVYDAWFQEGALTADAGGAGHLPAGELGLNQIPGPDGKE